MNRILHLSHTDITSDSRILKTMSAITREGNQYSVLGIGVSDPLEKHKSAIPDNIKIKLITLHGKNLKALPKFVRHFICLVELIFKMLPASIKERPKVIHCHDTLVLPLGLIVKFFTNSKLIYDAHELESQRNGLSISLGHATLILEKLAWPFIDSLITVSPSIEKWYKNNLGNKNAIITLNSPITKEKETLVNKNYLRKKFLIPEDKLVFIYIGILARGRGIDLIRNAFKSKQINSHIVFLGYGELQEELIEDSNQYSNIHVHSPVPHGQVVTIAQSADVGLCLVENISLSDYYCLPNKLFEYAFSEIPVIASNFPDIKKVVDEYELGRCTDLNITSIQIAISDCEKNPLSKIESDRLYNLSW